MLSNYVEKLYNLSLELRKQFLSNIFILPWFDNFFSIFYEFLHLTQRNWCIWFHKKKIVYLIPFHKTEFSNSFCQRFFYSPFSLILSKFRTVCLIELESKCDHLMLQSYGTFSRALVTVSIPQVLVINCFLQMYDFPSKFQIFPYLLPKSHRCYKTCRPVLTRAL